MGRAVEDKMRIEKLLALGLIAAIFAVSYLREDAGDSAGDVADKNPSDKQE